MKTFLTNCVMRDPKLLKILYFFTIFYILFIFDNILHFIYISEFANFLLTTIIWNSDRSI